MSDDPRERSIDDGTVRYLEAVLGSIVYGAGAYVNTLLDFLFRPGRFDAALLAEASERDAAPGRRRYLPPLSFLLLNQVFYFYVYPRRERGPTRALIEWMPAPIRFALDRIESSLRDPSLVPILLVVGPLVLIAALHALFTTWGFRAQRTDVRFGTVLAATCYSVGAMLGLVGLSAVVGATLTDRALSGALQGLPLAGYLILVAGFVVLWLRCISRHFAVVRAAASTSWLRTIVVVLGATCALGLVVASLLALGGSGASDRQRAARR
jgi:hypothetical protein